MLETTSELSFRDREKIRECCRYLMRHKFILNTEELHELFLTATNPVYEDTIREVFDYTGFDYSVSTDTGREAVMISDRMEDERLVPRLGKTWSTLLLLLVKEYKTRVSSLTTMTPSVEAHELIVMYNTYSRKAIDLKSLKEAVYYFKDFNLVSVGDVRKKDFADHTLITIFPSILYLVPNSTIEDLGAVLEEYRAESRNSLDPGDIEDQP